MAVESFCREPKLNDDVARQVLQLELAAFLPPEAQEGGLVAAHDKFLVLKCGRLALCSVGLPLT
jgi:hypothetical protein